jgi:hypothetical protein
MITFYPLALLLLWSGIAHSTRSLPHQPTLDPATLNIKRALAQGRHIFARDVCDTAFPGEGAVQNLCTPSNTLCCVRKSAPYPQCQNFLGKGWCCVAGATADDNGCYVDQESVCGQSGSVSCSGLAVGVSQACCPRLTRCATGYNFTLSFVRCQIQSTALVALASASLSSSSSSRTTSTSVSSVQASTTPATTLPSTSLDKSPTSPATTSTSTSPPPAGSSSPALSGGAIAGIAIGPALALLGAFGLWFLYRRRQKKKELQHPHLPPYPQQYPVPAYQDGLHPAPMTSPPMTTFQPYKPQYVAPQELPGQDQYGQNRHELDTRSDGRY